MAKTFFKSYIRKINGTLVLCYQGQSANTVNHVNRHIECYRMFDNGLNFCRNLYINNYTHGYFCIFPGEKFTYYRGGEENYSYTQEWVDDINREIGCYNTASENDIKLICSVYPDFIYTYRKMIKTAKRPPLYGVWQALQIWKKHKEIEFFFACGLYAHCFTKSIYKLPKAKQLQLCKYCYAHREVIQIRGIDYRELTALIKYNITEEKEINDYISFLRENPKFRTPEHFAYIKRQIEKSENDKSISYFVATYKDYYKMAKELGNDMKDPYHLNPSNLMERHDKVFEQLENVRKAKQEKEMKEKAEGYIKAVKKYFKYNCEDFMGYSIFIPSTIKEISEQAEKLGQCLIRCDYVSSVINRRCVLVFIQSKKGEPLATAEINPIGKIIQFRGNHNCDVDKEKTVIFHKWLESHPIRIRQNNRNKKAA